MRASRSMGLLFSVGLAASLVLAACGGAGGGGAAPGTATGAGAGGTKAVGGAAGGTGNATTCKAGSAVKTDGGFTMVCLQYNEQAFGVSGATCGAGPGPCFDQGGNSLDPADPVWPKPNTEATASGIKFWFPPTGGGKTAVKSAINFGPEVGAPVTVTVPQGKYTNLDLLAGAGNSNASQMADIQFNFTDGSNTTAQQNIDDWCNTTPVGQPGFVPADRWDSGGNPTTPNCGVFAYTVPIAGGKTLKSIVFTNDSANGTNFEPNILALTLK